MNPQRDLNILTNLTRERQAQMRREARIAHVLRSRNPGRKKGNAMLRQKLTLALIGALLVAMLFAQLVAAV